MSFNTGIEVMLHKRRVIDAEIAAHLINHPNCLDNNSQKEDAFQIAIDHLAWWRDQCVSSDGRISDNWAETIKLGVLIDEVIDSDASGNDEKKYKYSVQIAQYLLDTPKSFLSRIPEGTLDMAFQIVIQYLEEVMGSWEMPEHLLRFFHILKYIEKIRQTTWQFTIIIIKYNRLKKYM